MRNDTGDALWFIANVLVAVMAVATAYYDGLLMAVLLWIVLTLVLLFFRPQ